MTPTQPLAFDPMASLLEECVRPRLEVLRRAAIRAWVSALNTWVIAEESLKGHDTERLERLVNTAWAYCKKEIGVWDSRFALQSVRSLPPEIIDLAIQLAYDSEALTGVLWVATAAAIAPRETRWPRGETGGQNWINLTPDEL